MNKNNKSKSGNSKHSKSVDNIANAYKQSQETKRYMPKMNLNQTVQLVNRLSENNHAKEGDYEKII